MPDPNLNTLARELVEAVQEEACGLLIHQHFDPTGGSGTGCPQCLRNHDRYQRLRNAAEAIRTALDSRQWVEAVTSGEREEDAKWLDALADDPLTKNPEFAATYRRIARALRATPAPQGRPARYAIGCSDGFHFKCEHEEKWNRPCIHSSPVACAQCRAARRMRFEAGATPAPPPGDCPVCEHAPTDDCDCACHMVSQLTPTDLPNINGVDAIRTWRSIEWGIDPPLLCRAAGDALAAALVRAEWERDKAVRNFAALARERDAALAQLREAREDTARLDWLCDEPSRRFNDTWRLWDGESSFRNAIDTTRGKARRNG